MDNRYFSEKVVKWYEHNKRDLPWRESSDPYKIWLSEIILQQTRVIQGLPYYLRFIERFPSVTALAQASEQEVLRLWQGLGYYTRARNLHKCAKKIVSDHKGVFPGSFAELKKLPGIGDYTAAAIASIAHQEPVAVVDGNVFRVLSRIFGIETEINSPKGKKIFTDLANKLISQKHPEKHNQAVMEFGALHCTPKNPSCNMCVFSVNCIAFKNNLQDTLPVKTKAKPVRKRYFYYFIFKKGKSLLMKQRQQKDIWFGLYDFFLIEKKKASKIDLLLQEQKSFAGLNVNTLEISAVYKHVLSHQIIIARFILVENSKTISANKNEFRFYSKSKIAELPKPVLISRFLQDYQLL